MKITCSDFKVEEIYPQSLAFPRSIIRTLSFLETRQFLFWKRYRRRTVGREKCGILWTDLETGKWVSEEVDRQIYAFLFRQKLE